MNYLRLFAVQLCCLTFCTVYSQNNANWMGRIGDDVYVNEISIPGTHDSATGDGFAFGYMTLGSQFALTQAKSISKQWASGIRAFDLRPAVSGSDLILYHGIMKTNISLKSALRIIRDSLSQHPTEMAIVLIRHETEADDSNSQWNSLMTTMLSSDEFRTHFVPFTHDMTLGNARSKILILSRDQYSSTPTGAFITGWAHESDFANQQGGRITGANGAQTYLYLQDWYDCSGTNGLATQ